MVAGVPNVSIAFCSTTTAFSEVASGNSCAAAMHLDASSRYVIRLSPLKRGSFMTCQSTCHIAFEYLLSKRTHFLFFDFEKRYGILAVYP